MHDAQATLWMQKDISWKIHEIDLKQIWKRSMHFYMINITLERRSVKIVLKKWIALSLFPLERESSFFYIKTFKTFKVQYSPNIRMYLRTSPRAPENARAIVLANERLLNMRAKMRWKKYKKLRISGSDYAASRVERESEGIIFHSRRKSGLTASIHAISVTNRLLFVFFLRGIFGNTSIQDHTSIASCSWWRAASSWPF